MSIGTLDAANAYGRALGTVRTSGAEQPTTESGFGDMVKDLVGNAASTMGKAEAASAAQVAGKGDLIDVVTAIGAAEMALDTLVAVRDRVVGAYSDIMRMQI